MFCIFLLLFKGESCLEACGLLITEIFKSVSQRVTRTAHSKISGHFTANGQPKMTQNSTLYKEKKARFAFLTTYG